MQIKKIRGKSVKEALEKVKAELGPEAVLLHTRKVSSGVFTGLRKEEYEVTAGLDEAAAAAPGAGGGKPLNVPFPATAVLEPAPAAGEADDAGFGALHDDLRRMRGALQSLSTKFGPKGDFVSGTLGEFRNLLVQSEMDENHVELLLSCLEGRIPADPSSGKAGIRRALIGLLAERIPCRALGRRGGTQALRVALVGPTGAGKTTTIAKLASHFALRERLKVALVAADNYRIAAVEQLQSFAEIAGLPVEVVFNEREMTEALKKFDEYDLVFIDTAGRSQRNAGHMDELRKLLAAARPDEVHLALSLTTKVSDLKDIARRYAGIGFQKFLFTKLDETSSFGPIFSLTSEFKKPVSYVSVGQQVPDDICLADPQELSVLIAGEERRD